MLDTHIYIYMYIYTQLLYSCVCKVYWVYKKCLYTYINKHISMYIRAYITYINLMRVILTAMCMEITLGPNPGNLRNIIM